MKYSLLSFKIFFDFEKIIFENFNISENNIISVQLAKVLLGYLPTGEYNSFLGNFLECFMFQCFCFFFPTIGFCLSFVCVFWFLFFSILQCGSTVVTDHT